MYYVRVLSLSHNDHMSGSCLKQMAKDFDRRQHAALV